MSVTQDLRTRRKHRGLTPWQLVKKIGRLEREADATVCQLVALATEIDELRTERSELEAERDRTAITHRSAVDDLTAERDHWMGEALALKARFSAQIAADANKVRVKVPPAIRDTSAMEDQATGPIYVQPLWDAANAGLLGAVGDPGRIR